MNVCMLSIKEAHGRTERWARRCNSRTVGTNGRMSASRNPNAVADVMRRVCRQRKH